MPRPTTTIVGTPISSASLNFTPGLTPSRSSNSTRTPADSSSAASASAAGRCGPPSLPAITRCTSAGATSRGQHRPSSSKLASAMAATARDTPTPYEPIVTVTSLPFSSSHLQAERLGVLAAELEDVADLDAAGDLERAAAVRAHVAGAHLGRLDHAVGGEVAPEGEVDHVLAGLVGAGDPPRALDDPGVDEEPDARRALEAERARADVALDERRVRREVGLVERHDLGRADLRLERA